MRGEVVGLEDTDGSVADLGSGEGVGYVQFTLV